MQVVHVIDDAVAPNITEARLEHNKTAPQPDPAKPLAPGAVNPNPIDTNEAFMKYQLDELVRGWIKKYGLLPVPPPPAAPPDPNAVPQRVSRKQGLKALARADQVGLPAPIYEADVAAKIEGLPETTPAEKLRKSDMRIEFHGAAYWVRGNEFFETMVASMGITPVQRDALLKLAATFLE